MRFAIVNLVFILVFCGGAVCLQIFLSKMENKFLGLILPAIVFGLSLVVVVSNLTFVRIKSESISTIDENGVVIQKQVIPEEQDAALSGGDLAAAAFTAVIIFLMYNIPTVILLTIYSSCRLKRAQKKLLEKMQLQDLE